MNIVLLEPEIPHNTGAIGRTCYATNSKLHLIRPLGFSTDEKSLRRSGLDYWKNLDVQFYDNFEEFKEKNQNITLYMATTKAKQTYDKVCFKPDDFIMFGKESKGIPEEILLEYPKTSIRIPMYENIRSLNLSVSVGIVLYEALRQNGFENLELHGQLHNHAW